jgi:hypothetical protein
VSENRVYAVPGTLLVELIRVAVVAAAGQSGSPEADRIRNEAILPAEAIYSGCALNAPHRQLPDTTWRDVAGYFTCDEADTIEWLLRHVGQLGSALAFADEHQTADLAEGDLHAYGPNGEPR